MVRRYLYYGAFLAAAVVAALFLYRIRGIFPPFIFAIVLAYVLSPLVEFLEKHGFSRIGALLIIYLTLGGLFAIGAVEVLPLIIHELNALSENIPQYTKRAQEMISLLNQEYARVELPQSIRQVLDDAVNRAETEMIALIGYVFDGFFGIFTQLVGLLIAPILAFYMLKDLVRLKGVVLRAIPCRFRGDLLSLLEEIDKAVGGFIRGHILVSLLVALLSSVGLYLLGIDFAILIGLIAGVTNIIPYFGPIIGAIPALLMASLQSTAHIFYVLLLFIVIQQAESNIFAPAIIGERVGLHPLMVIFALLVGGELFGLLGLLVAVPVTGIFKAVICWLWFRQQGRKREMFQTEREPPD